MPNGGYPLSLALLLGDDVDVYLRLQGATVQVMAWEYDEIDGRPRMTPDPIAELSKEQADSLLFHLMYWRLGQRSLVDQDGQPRLPGLRPHFHGAKGVWYAL